MVVMELDIGGGGCGRGGLPPETQVCSPRGQAWKAVGVLESSRSQRGTGGGPRLATGGGFWRWQIPAPKEQLLQVSQKRSENLCRCPSFHQRPQPPVALALLLPQGTGPLVSLYWGNSLSPGITE